MPKRTKKTSTSAEKTTHVVFIVDRSGSMMGLSKQVVDGINEQIGTLQNEIEKTGRTLISVLHFDDKLEWKEKNVPVQTMKTMQYTDFVPRGGTALRDAIGAGIAHLREQPTEGDVAFLISVLSDGHENASKEINALQLADQIKKLQDTNQWTFTYMLANQDVNAFAQTYNVPVNNIVSWTSDVAGAQHVYAVNSSGLRSYSNARGMGVTATMGFYSDGNSTPDLNIVHNAIDTVDMNNDLGNVLNSVKPTNAP